MPLVEWDETMSVGIAAVDADHRKLFSLVNFLYDSLQVGRGQQVVGNFLDAVIIYTQEHFAREENLLSSAGYPGLAAHKQEHQDLIKQILDVQAKYKAGDFAPLSLELIGFLNTWLVDHVRGSDKDYVPHLKSKHVS
jgi:hemerythrin-like metal-binding protein